MTGVLYFVINFLTGAFRSRISLLLEIAALRHQLSLYQWAQRRPAITSSDRLIWSLLARLWWGWRGALYFVRSRTVILLWLLKTPFVAENQGFRSGSGDGYGVKPPRAAESILGCFEPGI